MENQRSRGERCQKKKDDEGGREEGRGKGGFTIPLTLSDPGDVIRSVEFSSSASCWDEVGETMVTFPMMPIIDFKPVDRKKE